VKVGGALLARVGALELVARALEAELARGARLLVVPGGGPFAETVRAMDASHRLGDGAAHWMAILGMEQYAHLLVAHIPGARLVEHRRDLEAAYRASALPVLAPYRWLREADPLPHGWQVTSDSIAAWVAGQLGARRLILVKPVLGERAALVDPYFERALPSEVRVVLTDAEGLTEALRAT
jgi:aspartokinase-like uncharacterized kinase